MKKIMTIFVLQMLCILALNIPYKTALVFEKENSNQVIAFVPMERMDGFQISYTHSIHLTEVNEEYKVLEDGNIVQIGLVYENYGIGMPSDAYGEEVFEKKDGKIHISNMSRTFPFIDIRLGKVVANHHLNIRDKNIPLIEYLSPGSWVRVKHRSLNVIEVIKGVNLYDAGN
jgi:hypothetical protein